MSTNQPSPHDDSKIPKAKSEDVSHEHRAAYFRRGEITLLVNHNTGFNDWNSVLTTLSEMTNVKLKFVQNPSNGDYQPISTFPGETNISFLHLIIDDAMFEVPEEETTPEIWQVEDTLVITTLETLNTYAQKEILQEVLFQSAAPNWLFTSSTHILTDGGPGGLPVPVSSVPSTSDYEFYKPEIDSQIGTCSGSKTVNVVIFDAVPATQSSGTTGQAAATSPLITFAAHPIVSALTKAANPKLDIQNSSITGIRLPTNFKQNSERRFAHQADYDISNHGLFIAGIINDLAPNAQIKLVEVLNHDGVGSIETLAAGFSRLCNGQIIPTAQLNASNTALVVNCSLCLEAPLPNERGEIKLIYRDSHGNIRYELLVKQSQMTVDQLRVIIDSVQTTFPTLDSQVVAAAGNQGTPSGTPPPPPASYPAAFPNVLGVGAMDDTINRSWYSNLADNPPENGVVVFGGKADAPLTAQTTTGHRMRSKSNITEGILGVYLGMFPDIDAATGDVTRDKHPPTNGWARWAGTSFATGVMSGILARAAGNGCTISIQTTGNVFERIKNKQATPRTIHGEVIIKARQGTPPIFLVIWWAIISLLNSFIRLIRNQ